VTAITPNPYSSYDTLTLSNPVTSSGIVPVMVSWQAVALGNPIATTQLVVRQGGVLDVGGGGTPSQLYAGGPLMRTLNVGFLQGSGIVDNQSINPVALTLGTLGGAVNVVFSGIIQNTGGGPLTVITNGGGGISYLTGLNTYTGATILGGSQWLGVNSLANGGMPSSIGASSNAASNLVFNGGALQYTGSNTYFAQFTQTPSVSTDRLFTLAGNATLDSSGNYGSSMMPSGNPNNAALVFSNAGSVGFAGAGARSLTLQGNSTGDNEIHLALVDNPKGGALSITKNGQGQWLLTGANTYSGPTTINSGVLQVKEGSLPTTTNVRLWGGILQSSGTLNWGFGSGPGQIQYLAGGFAASGDKLILNFANGAMQYMGSGGFLTSTLSLGSPTATGNVEIISPLNLGVVQRTINVDDNQSTGTDYAIISGPISGGVLDYAQPILVKTGGGNLVLSGANRYFGATQLMQGALTVTSIGADGATSSSVGTNVGTSPLVLGNNNSTVTLLYVGPGEVTTRPISLGATNANLNLDASGSGPLVLTSILNDSLPTSFSGNGPKIINLRGLSTASNAITGVLSDYDGDASKALQVTKIDSGVWALAPSSYNTFSGTLLVSAGMLGLNQYGPGTAGVTLSGGGIFAYGGPLVSGSLFTMTSGAAVFGGSNPITLTNTLVGSGGNWTVNTSLDNGALLSINKFTGTGGGLSIKGYGSTVFSGTIYNGSLTIQTANTASVTLGGSNLYAGVTTLNQGILILNNGTPGAKSSPLLHRET
jgi:autotransporter-associated beta strand protein